MQNRTMRNQEGITLVELLVTLLLFSMLASILYAFMLMGVSMYKRVSAETTMRNQSDMLLAGIITELTDAVHAAQGADHREIHYVKMSSDPNQYVDAYRMVLEERNGRYGVSAYKAGAAIPFKRFVLGDEFAIHVNGTDAEEAADPKSSLLANDGTGIYIKLVISREVYAQPAQRTAITVETRIPLTRLE